MSRFIRVTFAALGLLTASSVAHAPLVAQQDPVELEELVVTATATPLELSRLGNHVTLIDGEEITARGIRSVSDVLREVPGLAVVRSGSFGGATSVFFRGGESDYTLVLVDGVQMNQPGGAFDFSGLTTENIERIEVVRGPSSALHGSDAMAGVIHIITKSGGGDTRASANFNAGSFGRFDSGIEVSGGDDRASYGISFARYRTDGILDFNNDFENTVLTGKAAFQLDDRTRANVSARFGDRQFNFPTDFSGAVVDENQFSYNDENAVSISVDRQLSDAVVIRALVTSLGISSGTDDRQDGPADTLGFYGFESLDSYRRNSIDLRATFDLGEGALTVGSELEEQRIRSFNASESAFGPSSGRSTNERENLAGYANLSQAFGAIDVNAGLRYEDNERYGGFTTWQLGASIALSENTRVRGLFGRAIKEPTFFETFAEGFTRGNPDLDPETSTSLEFGIEQTLLDGALTLQATAFAQAFEDLIQYTFTPETPGGPNYYNVAEADASGLEVGARWNAGAFRFFTDWTLLETEVTDSGFDSGEGATFVEGSSLLRRPDTSGRIGAEFVANERLSFDAVARRVGEREDRDFNAFPAAPIVLEAYTVFDLGLRAAVAAPEGGRPGFDLTLRVENLSDEEYVEVFGFRTPGRGIYLGGRLTWGR